MPALDEIDSPRGNGPGPIRLGRAWRDATGGWGRDALGVGFVAAGSSEGTGSRPTQIMQVGVDDPISIARTLAMIGIKQKTRRVCVRGETNQQ